MDGVALSLAACGRPIQVGGFSGVFAGTWNACVPQRAFYGLRPIQVWVFSAIYDVTWTKSVSVLEYFATGGVRNCTSCATFRTNFRYLSGGFLHLFCSKSDPKAVLITSMQFSLADFQKLFQDRGIVQSGFVSRLSETD